MEVQRTRVVNQSTGSVVVEIPTELTATQVQANYSELAGMRATESFLDGGATKVLTFAPVVGSKGA